MKFEKHHYDAMTHAAEAFGIKTMNGHAALAVMMENVVRLELEQQNYGTRNQALFGTFGVVVRLSDKIERLKHVFGHKGRKRSAVNREILDLFDQLCNDAVVARLVETNQWTLDLQKQDLTPSTSKPQSSSPRVTTASPSPTVKSSRGTDSSTT